MKIAVFYGGKSCEHSVSVVTGVSVISALELSGAEVYAIYIDKNGLWWRVKNYSQLSAYSDEKLLKRKRVQLVVGEKKLIIGLKRVEIDCAVLCLHGAYGEDGCIQGALSLSFIPYTGSGVLGSAIGLDKVYSKLAFSSSSLKITDYFTVSKADWENEERVKKLALNLGYPLVVKPRSLGSSIGVSVVGDDEELTDAINLAMQWDNGVIVEKKVENLVEFNCAVIGDGENYEVSEIEKPFAHDEILSFADKYQRGGFKGEGSRQFPAKIPDKLTKKIKNCAVVASKAVGVEGIARVDFLYNGEDVFVNEINTIPGSLALYLFPNYRYKSQVGEIAVLNKLIDLAIERNKSRNLLRYEYLSQINNGEKILLR